MMAYLEMQAIDDAAEPVAFLEHEVSCPFCEECSWLSVSVDDDGSHYICGKCDESWTVVQG